MQELRQGLYPPGGYSFTEKDGTRFEHSDLIALVNLVWGYRQRNRFPIGNPYEEVQAQICERQPGVCQEVNSLTQPVDPFTALRGKVAEKAAFWMDELARRRMHLAPRIEQDVRAEKCSRCPHCVDWKSKECTHCEQNVLDILTAAVKPQVPHERMEGKACRLAAEDLSVGVMVQEGPFLSEAPDYCWRKMPL